MRLIAYYPFRVDATRPSASQLRPQRMVEGFRELGYDVEVVSGYAKERKVKCKELRRRILEGEHFDFVYSEASTMPTLLTEQHHYPTHPWFDFNFLRFCKKRGMRIGLFYRDAHWAFPEHYISGLRAWFARWFYRYDLWQYNRVVDRLYMPSLCMLDHLPYGPKMPVSALPPGSEIHELQRWNGDSSSETLSILYVGGLSDLYDITLFVECLGKLHNIKLTLCCREREWNAVQATYRPLMTDRVRIVHQQGETVRELYRTADYACLAFSPVQYNLFSIPYKLFESIGCGVPVLTYAFGQMGRMVQELGIGYVSEYDADSLLHMLRGLKKPTQSLRQHLLEEAKRNSWLNRCRQVVVDLTRR